MRLCAVLFIQTLSLGLWAAEARRDHFPDWSPDGESLVFVSNRDGDDDLYIYSFKDQRTRQLTFNEVEDGHPRWSPDGKWIAFFSERDGNRELYQIGVDGSGLQRLTDDPGRDEAPSWLPNGKGLVFSSTRDDKDGDIYQLMLESGQLTRLTSQPGRDHWPTVTPDGRLLSFTSDRVPYYGQNLMLAAADGSYPHPLGRDFGDQYLGRFLPDGDHLVYSWKRGEQHKIYLVNRDCSIRKNLSGKEDGDLEAAASPDGSQIAFVHSVGGERQVWLMDHEGQNRRVLIKR